ncbi:MAG TPA: hypothetical protein VKR56_04960 [Candidatus Cybelea sp.]|nr:hypothetical protein [Candidatus Cybelea sp.]
MIEIQQLDLNRNVACFGAYGRLYEECNEARLGLSSAVAYSLGFCAFGWNPRKDEVAIEFLTIATKTLPETETHYRAYAHRCLGILYADWFTKRAGTVYEARAGCYQFECASRLFSSPAELQVTNYQYGMLLGAMGSFDEAEARLSDGALQADECGAWNGAAIRGVLAEIYIITQRYDDALALVDVALRTLAASSAPDETKHIGRAALQRTKNLAMKQKQEMG